MTNAANDADLNIPRVGSLLDECQEKLVNLSGIAEELNRKLGPGPLGVPQLPFVEGEVVGLRLKSGRIRTAIYRFEWDYDDDEFTLKGLRPVIRTLESINARLDRSLADLKEAADDERARTMPITRDPTPVLMDSYDELDEVENLLEKAGPGFLMRLALVKIDALESRLAGIWTALEDMKGDMSKKRDDQTN